MSTTALVLPGDDDVLEFWDGGEVVKGQPTARHEAIRADLVAQLVAQRPEGLSVQVSSSIEDSGTAPTSDASVLGTTTGPVSTLVWVPGKWWCYSEKPEPCAVGRGAGPCTPSTVARTCPAS
jgi:hypothetical protein